MSSYKALTVELREQLKYKQMDQLCSAHAKRATRLSFLLTSSADKTRQAHTAPLFKSACQVWVKVVRQPVEFCVHGKPKSSRILRPPRYQYCSQIHCVRRVVLHCECVAAYDGIPASLQAGRSPQLEPTTLREIQSRWTRFDPQFCDSASRMRPSHVPAPNRCSESQRQHLISATRRCGAYQTLPLITYL